MPRRLSLLVLIVTVLLAVGCGDQPSLTSTKTSITVQITDTPESTKVAPSPSLTPTEDKPALLPVPPENPTIIQLTDNPGWKNENPVWSPDGSKIIYMSDRDCVKPYLDSELERYLFPWCREWDLYLMDADGSNEIRLTDVQFIYEWTKFLPRWSPNGERIAFLYNDFRDIGYKKVVSFSLDRARQRPLKLDDMEVLVAASEGYLVKRFEWSPDGRMYAYNYFPLWDERRDIFVIDEESGEELFRKTTTGDTLCLFEAWSMDSDGILTRCWREDKGAHIYWVDLADGTEKLLIENAVEPVWSPDGKWVLYYSNEHDQYELFNVESGEVVPFPYDNYYIGIIWSWSPDGKWIAYGDFVDHERSKMDILLLDMSWLEMEWEKE